MLQCTSKADMEDWVRDTNRLRGGRVDLASGQDIGGQPPGHDIYESRGNGLVVVWTRERKGVSYRKCNRLLLREMFDYFCLEKWVEGIAALCTYNTEILLTQYL